MSFLDNLKKKASAVIGAQKEDSSVKSFTFESIPTTLDELKALPGADLKDPFAVAALGVLALNMYPVDKDTCCAMLDFLMGPTQLSTYDKQFLKDRFADSDYVPRSYFEGATPANNYEPAEPFTIKVRENPYSRDNISEGYITLYLTSGGADSQRPISLRTKASTGEWFLNGVPSILAGIRKPASADPWA